MRELRIRPEDWEEVVARTDGPQIVVGGPGTGKTEFLVRRVTHLLTAGNVPSDDILVLSFSRRAVADISDRIHTRTQRPAAPVPTATFHSLAAALVEAHADETPWGLPPVLLTGSEQTALVHELLVDDPAGNWSPAYRSMLGSSTLAQEVADMALRAAEQLLEPADLEMLAEQRPQWRGLGPFLERYRTELIARNRIDYGQLLLVATRLAEYGLVDRNRYRYVLVDEYQDTSVAQSRLVRSLTSQSHNLTAAADPYQSIYSFRGARVANVASFAADMGLPGGPDAIRIVLTTSFRTPKRILAAAERITSSEVPGAAGPVEPASGDGEVSVHVFDQQTAEAEWIAAEIERIHLLEHTPYGSIAVFVRSSRRFVAELSRVLQRRHIAHDTPTDRLIENPTVRFVLDAVAAASGHGIEQDRAVRSLLVGPWVGLGLGEVRTLERTKRSEGHSWAHTISVLDKPGMASLAGLLADDSWATTLPGIEGLWTVWLTAARMGDIVENPDRRDERSAWTSLTQVIGRWNERNPAATLTDYRKLLLDADFEARPLLSYEPDDADRLTVTTMHQAKGLEFDYVFIADAVDGVLPDLRVRDSLLGVRHLLPDVPRDPAGYARFRLQEERRLAYTAMTRARRRVVWTATSTGFELGQGAPSRFLPLIAGTTTVADAATSLDEPHPPVTPAEAEAVLRRVFGDPVRPPGERLAALDVLGRGPAWNLRSITSFAGVASRGADTGLADPHAALSATRADAYDRCPRRYAMERRLGIGQGDTNHLVFGRLIHGVLEAATHEAMAGGDPLPARSVVMEQLTLQFNGADFGGPPFDTAWWDRAVSTLDAYLEKRPTRGRIVAAEHSFDIDIGGQRWRGVIDAVIDHGGGKLTIVDYKTSSAPMSIAEAGASLQLGLYAHAGVLDPHLASLGTPVGAEYWYLYHSADKKSMTTRSFDPAQLPLVHERLDEIAAAMNADRWDPQPGEHCERCPVRRSCPALPRGAEGFVA